MVSHSTPTAIAMTKRGILDELWARHVPDKNLYQTTDAGRRFVVARVFQRKSAPMWAFFDCETCVRNDVVCSRHQFVIYGHHGVQQYVENGYYWRDTDFPPMPRPPRRNRGRSSTASNTSVETLSRILTDTLNLKPDFLDDLLRSEVSLRVDIMDEHDADHRALWRSFRSDLGEIFLRETGIHLPPCSRFPQGNLYTAFREAHRAQRRSQRAPSRTSPKPV